eukprot:1183991-Prorocentrum_minimum.AAC.4
MAVSSLSVEPKPQPLVIRDRCRGSGGANGPVRESSAFIAARTPSLVPSRPRTPCTHPQP